MFVGAAMSWISVTSSPAVQFAGDLSPRRGPDISLFTFDGSDKTGSKVMSALYYHSWYYSPEGL